MEIAKPTYNLNINKKKLSFKFIFKYLLKINFLSMIFALGILISIYFAVIAWISE